ncbi:hypothetical protein G7046_g8986 [Stylonectria norvegica]|nr:hypothetical protein G7046_g8986 [Stylonectria norvegica]
MSVEPAPQALESPAPSDYTRLHITPFDPELLKIIIPASVVPKARNISYHTIDTFPDRRYGFVELPKMDAEKIKKKLDGSTLKGTKVCIDKARPEHRLESAAERDQADQEKETKEEKKKKAKERSEGGKKRKRDLNNVEGVAITDRKVKRGWTDPTEQRRKKSKKDKDEVKEGKATEKKKRLKSKYTEKEECLLKTKVPPNAVGNIKGDNLPKKHRKKSKARDVIVHEFEKTTKFPTFLKDAAPDAERKPATEFIEGRGWVDEDGNVTEVVKTKAKPSPAPKKATKAKRVVEEQPAIDEDDETSSSGTSSSGESSDEESEDEEEEAEEANSLPDQDAPTQPQLATSLSTIKADVSRPMSSSSTRSLTIKIPPPTTPSATKVHPLEALYKRPKPDAITTTADTGPELAPFAPFSFFDADADEEDQDDILPSSPNRPLASDAAPMTPFTRQDFEFRATRSAAPTPDTAHPSRMRNFWAARDDDADDVPELNGEMDEDEDEEAEKPVDGPGAGDFQSWFWDNRRDLNKSWMTRRKTAAKEKRHRDNKARANKAV